jgi:zona occludens toxin (predicted ATPase)
MEESATLIPLKDTANSADLYTALQYTLKMYQLKINKMFSSTTDGAVRQQRRNSSVDRKNKTQTYMGTTIMMFHCTVHQEILCAKFFPGFQHVLSALLRL